MNLDTPTGQFSQSNPTGAGKVYVTHTPRREAGQRHGTGTSEGEAVGVREGVGIGQLSMTPSQICGVISPEDLKRRATLTHEALYPNIFQPHWGQGPADKCLAGSPLIKVEGMR
ncbi:unnamed protein product [Penicillium manginii]